MWLFTEDGFFSAVLEQKGKHAGEIAIRARVRDDLERLLEKYGQYMPGATGISETPKNVVADYRYRIWLPREEYGVVVAMVAQAVAYGNFKSHVAETLGHERERPLHKIWSVMADLQPGGPYGWYEQKTIDWDWSGIGHLDFPTDEDLSERLAKAFDDEVTITHVRPYDREGKKVSGYKQKRKRGKGKRRGRRWRK